MRNFLHVFAKTQRPCFEAPVHCECTHDSVTGKAVYTATRSRPRRSKDYAAGRERRWVAFTSRPNAGLGSATGRLYLLVRTTDLPFKREHRSARSTLG